MKRLLASVFTVAGVCAAQAQPEVPAGEIAGTVACAQTAVPLKNARISLRLDDGAGRSSRSTLTDGAGRFVLTKLSPGKYRLSVEKAGYRDRREEPLAISLDKGRKIANVDIKLWRAGAISGRVRDWDGEPLVLARVRAYAVRYSNEKPELESREEVLSDEKGEYRISGLAAGKYIVAAWPPHPGAPVYHSDAASTAEAQRLKLNWGQELGPIDLQIPNRPAFTVTGRVEDGSKETPCRKCAIEAYRVDAFGMNLVATGSVSPTGTFVITGLAPGSYKVVGMLRGFQTLAGSRAVQIADRSLEGLTLVVGLGQAVTGEVIFEDPPADLKTDKITITAYGTGLPAFWPIGAAELEAGGRRFDMENLPGETYRFEVSSLPAGGYLKSLRVSRQELPAPELMVPGDGPLSGVSAVIAFDGASLSGRVKLARQETGDQPTIEARVALLPQDGQSRYLTHRYALSDSAGTFSFEGVPPGAYTIYAVPGHSTAELSDPDVRRTLEAYARNLELKPREKASIEVVLAPDPE